MSEKVKILIVDDYPENIKALAGLIEDEQVEIYSAGSADRALELLTEHDFGLALLDVQMPGMSGFELAELVRGVKKFRNLPIIFVTAHQHDVSVIFEGYKTGAVDLLFKPLDPHVVRSKVQVFVELHRQKRQLLEQVDELERLRVEADAASIAKSHFLANMSHEIRTPLAAVMGFASLVAQGKLSEKEELECSELIKKNGELLLRLVDDILDFSKIEANRLELENHVSSLKELFEELKSTMMFKAKEKNLELIIEEPKAQIEYFLMDTIRLKQVLLNVVGNAIKFTSQGQVRVRSQVSMINATHGKLEVLIEDDGIGMKEEQAERLFQPFTQGDASTKRKFGGTGLGLVISREIAIAMGGHLKLVATAPGKGSTFLFDCILEVAPSESTVKKMSLQSQNAELKFQGKRILAVDDSADNLVLLDYFLRGTGVVMKTAVNGQDALNHVANDRFDLILMDIQMPIMDGREATQALRLQGISCPIIALTAHATSSEHESCRASGCNDVFTKPLSREGLLQGLERHFN